MTCVAAGHSYGLYPASIGVNCLHLSALPALQDFEGRTLRPHYYYPRRPEHYASLHNTVRS